MTTQENHHIKFEYAESGSGEEVNPYDPPRLVEYGDVQDLTEGDGGTGTDFGGTHPGF